MGDFLWITNLVIEICIRIFVLNNNWVYPKIAKYFFWAPFREGVKPKEIEHITYNAYICNLI
jgi:hypothetical protein